MHRTILICFLFSTLSLGVQGLFAADTQNQSWVTYEQGNAAFAAKEFGRALQLYKNAISGAGVFPEAEMALGDVYIEEGESDLALRQYNKAYDMRKSFYIPDSQFQVLYKIARLYLMQHAYGQMQQTLLSITAEDKHFAETATFQLKSQIQKNYMDKGLDHVLMLYVFDDQFAAPAHSLLGWYYYRTGRQAQAIQELLYSLISRATEIVTFIHAQDVDYEFSTLADMLAVASKYKEAAAFLKEVDFFKDVYYLACATYASSYPKSAAVLWKFVAGSSLAGAYQDLSSKQLKKSWTEPLLMPPTAQ